MTRWDRSVSTQGQKQGRTEPSQDAIHGVSTSTPGRLENQEINRIFSSKEKWANGYLQVTRMLKLAACIEAVTFIPNEIKQNALSLNPGKSQQSDRAEKKWDLNS